QPPGEDRPRAPGLNAAERPSFTPEVRGEDELGIEGTRDADRAVDRLRIVDDGGTAQIEGRDDETDEHRRVRDPSPRPVPVSIPHAPPSAADRAAGPPRSTRHRRWTSRAPVAPFPTTPAVWVVARAVMSLSVS